MGLQAAQVAVSLAEWLLGQELLDASRELAFRIDFKLAVNAFDQYPFLVDEKARRRRIHAIHPADGAAGIAAHRERQAILVDELPRRSVFVPNDVHAEDLESLVVVLVVDLRQNGSLPLTVRSGGVPEVHQDRAAPEARQGDAVAIQEAKREIGRKLPGPGRLSGSLHHQVGCQPSDDEREPPDD